ncbi:unnamed protein product [Durusdinium trenchii]|uniref:Uncharacterized protein n=1 Tax=Durusdinium trenchii TaxID=1381693 RepID=A0ABP0Q673_9DINO
MGSGASTPPAATCSLAFQQLMAQYQLHGPDPQLLPAVRSAMRALHVRPADRSYRREFTENYVRLLGQEVNYRPEILTAALQHDPDLWVNGHLHHISPWTLQMGEMLSRCFLQLCQLLAQAAPRGTPPPTARAALDLPAAAQVLRAISLFESHWVLYEEAYIKDLIRIETLARRPLERAVALELQLSKLERRENWETQKETRQRLKAPVVLPLDSASLQPPNRRAAVSTESGSVQLSLPQHPRVVRNVSSDLSVFDLSECPRSRQQTLSGEAPLVMPAAASASAPPVSTDSAVEASAAPSTVALYDLAVSATSKHGMRRAFLHDLLVRVGELNACANARGKGRSDFSMEVLEVAAKLYLSQDGREASSAERVKKALARMVLEGFLALRHFFADISSQMLWIDPQLSHNEDLQQVLIAWEEAWELGSTFLAAPQLCHALCGVAAQMAAIAAGPAAPSIDFAQLLEDQSPELFMILPRLVLLWGLRDATLLPLAASLLPELQALGEKSGEAEAADGGRTGPAQLLAFHAAVQTAPELLAAVLRGPNSVEGQSEDIEAFLRALEATSLQLQRREPQKWNRCSSVLLRCMAFA